jgi:hypothetical protein
MTDGEYSFLLSGYFSYIIILVDAIEKHCQICGLNNLNLVSHSFGD